MPADSTATPASVPADGRSHHGSGDVTLVGDVIHLIGEADAAADDFLRSGASLQGVSAVDMTRAGYVDGDALHLVMRCVQQLQQQHPGARLQVRGADSRTRRQLELLGVAAVVDLRAEDEAPRR